MSAGLGREAAVDTAAIAANVRLLRRAAGTPHFMAVVKANGYGHGAARAARAALAGGADWLGVADITEALELRAAGVEAPLLAWLHGPGADFAAAAGIDVGVSSTEQLRQVASSAPGAHVQIKLDTGLSRNGVAPEDWGAVFGLAAELERDGALAVRGLFSHLANTSDESDAAASAAFAEAVHLARAAGLTPSLLHLSSTAAAIRHPQAPLTMVRCGIGIYGLSPFGPGDTDDTTAALVPAMTLRAEVIAVRRVQAGAGVSYDHTWTAPAATTLALVPLGYADGIPRAASGRAEVLVRGARRAVRGRIAMDQFVVDMGDDDVAVGDPVVVFGPPVPEESTSAPTADDWAQWAGTINYEIVTRIGHRVPRTDV